MKPCCKCNESKPPEAYRGNRKMCRACEAIRKHEWYMAQAVKPHEREDRKAYYREWYKAHAAEVKARAKEWAKNNPDKRREICRVNMERQRKNLIDAYVRRMLAQTHELKAADIPQPLVEVQRELLKLKRYLREHSV